MGQKGGGSPWLTPGHCWMAHGKDFGLAEGQQLGEFLR